MKRKLITALVVLLAATTAAGGEKPLRFERIPVRGEAKAFVRKAQRKGFKKSEKTTWDDTAIILKGTWRGIEETTLAVLPDDRGRIDGVGVLVPATSEWPEIRHLYYRIVEAYKEEYGEPAETTFSLGKYTREGEPADTEIIIRLIQGNTDIHTRWKASNGEVAVSVEYVLNRFSIVIRYLPNETLHYRPLDMVPKGRSRK